LVNNVLDFSRIEQGRKTYTPEALDLGDVVSRVLETQVLRIREQGMELERRLPAGPSWVRADRDALEQTLLNLLDNALKYAAVGKQLTVEVRPDGGGWEVAVADRGPGIPGPHRRRLFEKFHRVDDSLTARQPGCGLGLSIARQLMRDLGGDVVFQPREGGGASFVIRMPRLEGES